jgi:hypothetical protein
MNYLKHRTDVQVPGIPVAEFPYLRSPPSTCSPAPPTHQAPPAIDPLVSANDDEGPRKWYQIRFHNPLWVIAAAMGFLFTTMALIVGLG